MLFPLPLVTKFNKLLLSLLPYAQLNYCFMSKLCCCDCFCSHFTVLLPKTWHFLWSLPLVDYCYCKKIISPPALLAAQATAAALPLPLHCASVAFVWPGSSLLVVYLLPLVDCCLNYISPIPIDSYHCFCHSLATANFDMPHVHDCLR